MTLLKPLLLVKRLVVLQGGHTALDLEFHAGVNVIRGRNSSGKTTTMDLLAFSLGAESIRWKPQALLCTETLVEVQLNEGVVTLRREISTQAQQPMSIFWGALEDAFAAPTHAWERYPFKRTPQKISFSQALLNALEMPQAQGDGASNLTMHQILRVLYADQPSVHSPIFRVDRWDSVLTREMIGAYLTGIYDDELYSARLRVRDIEGQLSKHASDLKSIFGILGHTGNTPDLEFADDRIATLEARRGELNDHLAALKRGTIEPRAGLEASTEIELRTRLASAKRKVASIRDELERLELEAQDSRLFIAELQSRIRGLEESQATRAHLEDVSFSFCPCCLSEIEEYPDGTCSLCKASSSNEFAAAQILRMKNELSIQLKESEVLLQKRAATVKELEMQLPAAENEFRQLRSDYDVSLTSWSSATELAVESVARELGALDEEIQQALRMKSLSDAILELQRQRDALGSELSSLQDRIEALEATQETRKAEVAQEVEDAMIRLLREDLPLQIEFANAESAAFDFVDNAVYVNGSRNFSESSAVVLRHVFHLALLTASTRKPYMRLPHFMMLDGIDDGGMEKERSHRLQQIIVDECGTYQVDFQLIFATSEINPTLEESDLVVGRAFTPEERSLDVKEPLKLAT